jgi:hypothetical protein
MKVRDLIERLASHNLDANVRFSVADDASEDDQERWFAEDVHDCFGDRHPTGGIETETEVTLCLIVESNR